ncbi:hypothetical protein ACWCQW_38310 [Streptomyces mirabilis]
MSRVVSEVGNVPASFTSFVGRRREVAEIRRTRGTARPVTLTGMGVVGKTRLALELAATAGGVGGVLLGQGGPQGVNPGAPVDTDGASTACSP